MGLSYQEALDLGELNDEVVIPTFCSMCGPTAGCGIYAFVKDGVFKNVVGMNECPINKGGLCAKGNAGPQWVYSKDRLKKPLLRIGEKGEGKFKEISWDEALDIVAEKLKEQKEKYGAESLGILSPARRSYSEYIQRFLIAHGSPNYGHSGICAMQRAFGFFYTVGTFPQCDYQNADMIILWGRQPIYSGPAMGIARDFIQAKNRNAKIIAIKPSVEPDSGMADIWLPLRPGTDAALSLAMINIIINENLIDKEFVENWCYGYQELKEHIQKYTPEWAEHITGVKSEKIIEVARMYADTKAAVIDLGNGVEHSPSSSDAIRAVAILMAITGHLDRKGCNVFFPGPRVDMPQPKSLNLFDRYTGEMVEKLVGPEFPKEFQPFLEGTSSAYFKLIESVLTEDPYPIRTIIAPGTQPSVSTRGSKKVIEALKKLDFYVVVDVMKTADMDYADIVLPTATPYESDHPFEIKGNWIMTRNKVIEPLGEYKSIFEFFLELGKRMGYNEEFWDGDISKCQNDLISPFGMTIDELREYKTGKFYNIISGEKKYENYEDVFNRRSMKLSGGNFLPQGKVALYNTLFEVHGYNPLPEWHEPPESLTDNKKTKEKYPLVLSDYHTSKAYSASWQRNAPYLRECQPYPTLHIHPDTAQERDVKDGDWIKVESPHGWLKVKAEIYPGIRPDTVMMLHGWWQGCDELGFEDFELLDGGANVNNLYGVGPDAYDPLVTAMCSQTLVEVSRYE